MRTFRRILVAHEAKRKRGRRPRVRGVGRNFCLHYEPNCTFTRGRYRETMQDTRANMGAHLKWDIPMFLGIASTKDGRARAPIMSSTRRDISLSRLRKAFVSRSFLSRALSLFFFFFFFSSSLRSNRTRQLPIIIPRSKEFGFRKNRERKFKSFASRKFFIIDTDMQSIDLLFKIVQNVEQGVFRKFKFPVFLVDNVITKTSR